MSSSQKGNLVGEYRSTVTDVEDGRVGAVRITPKRAAHVTLFDSSGNELTTVTVSGTVAIDQTTPGTTNGVYINNDSIETTTGDAHNDLGINANWKDTGDLERPPRCDADGHPQVDVLSSALPTGAATAANQQNDALTDTELRASPPDVGLKSEAVRLDDVGGGTKYFGFASPGTATSASSWKIFRMSGTAPDFQIEFADGDSSYDNVWDNRAALSYS